MKLLICLLPILASAMENEQNNKLSQESQLAAANNAFSAKMFNEVAKTAKAARGGRKSVVMSGFSALSPLAQLGLASVGPSHDEILKAIGMPNDEVTKTSFASLNGNLRSVKGVELKVANRVYVPNGVELNEDFAKLSKENFGSDVKNIDFSNNVAAVKSINGWVEDNTNNRIKDLLKPDQISADTRSVLVNAIYFKGKWDKPFSKSATTDRDFHVSKEQTVKVPTMYVNNDLKYAESSELQAKLLELPYEGGETSMLIVLPNEIDGIDALQQKLLDPSALTRATEQMHKTEVDVYLPKFKIETTINLKDVLEKIGVKKLFGPEAMLNNLLKSESNLYVSDAIQKAFIEVSEEGTEAAAASVYEMMVGSSGVPRSVVVSVNKPFYFELKLNRTNVFTGFVMKP